MHSEVMVLEVVVMIGSVGGEHKTLEVVDTHTHTMETWRYWRSLERGKQRDRLVLRVSMQVRPCCKRDRTLTGCVCVVFMGSDDCRWMRSRWE